MSPALQLEGVSASLGDRQVLHHVDFSLAPGEVVALLGPSGAGKSTLLRIVLGFDAPSAGRVSIAGRLVSDGARRIVPPEARGLSMVFQDLALWPHLTVRGHLRFVLESLHVPATEHPERIETLLRRLDIADKSDRRPGELSGGERQRVAIARALVAAPAALLLDEPLANVDVALKDEMLGLFAELLQERGTPAIYVTHDPREACRLARRIAVLEVGRLVQQGAFAELRARPATAFVRRLVTAVDGSG